MMGGGRGQQAQPKNTLVAIDPDDPNLRPDAWFVYAAPVQSGVEMMGTGRYGFWDEKPKLSTDEHYITVTGNADEPTFVAPRAAMMTVWVAQAVHVSSYPLVQPQVTEDK